MRPTTRRETSYAEQVQPTPGFLLKGSHQLDRGKRTGWPRVISPSTGRSVMLAVAHDYSQGPTSGLERIELPILSLFAAL
jgi:3-hydroxy-5-phosphonooxypentane-2,4-dione thiolase